MEAPARWSRRGGSRSAPAVAGPGPGVTRAGRRHRRWRNAAHGGRPLLAAHSNGTSGTAPRIATGLGPRRELGGRRAPTLEVSGCRRRRRRRQSLGSPAGRPAWFRGACRPRMNGTPPLDSLSPGCPRKMRSRQPRRLGEEGVRRLPPAPRDENFRSERGVGDPGMSGPGRGVGGPGTGCRQARGLGKGSCVAEPAPLRVQPRTWQPYPDLQQIPGRSASRVLNLQ